MNAPFDPAQLSATNLRGITAMIVSMAFFTVNDTLVKLTTAGLPLGEVIFLRNGFATLFIVALAAAFGGLVIDRATPMKLHAGRLTGEVGATLMYLAALSMLPIADAIAIGQFTPLAITAAAAWFLGEPVGWRRWLAAAVGFAGVLLIIRPGTHAFSAAGLLALGSIVFVVMRDLMTRQISPTVPTLTLTALSSASVMLLGLALWPFEIWQTPSLAQVAAMMVAGLFLLGAYMFVIIAMRSGEVPVVAPFRYTVILWAILAGFIVWRELPDAISLIGITIVCAAGIYTFHREYVLKVRRGRMGKLI